MSRLGKGDSSSWFQGSVEDEEDDDEDFIVVELENEDGEKLEDEWGVWDEPRLIRLEGIDVVSEHSKVLSVTQIQQVSQELPAALRLREWMLAYRTQNHGSSLRTLYRTTSQMDACMILLVKDTYGQVYKWTGLNSYFIKGSMDSLMFGGGLGQFGLWLHGDMLRGRSQRCETFDNDVLSSEEDFIISELEVWAFV